MTKKAEPTLQQLFSARYSDPPEYTANETGDAVLRSMSGRGSCRSFEDRVVPQQLLEVLCAAALASPTKSDLQQRDIILLHSEDLRQRLAQLVKGQAWVAKAPMIAVFCGNNRRQRLMHEWHDVPFANDHLDAFFNAAGDAAIALGAFVMAAEAVGLGCCPISAVRNEASQVSQLLGLPDHVFPFAGLTIGYPSEAPPISKRLPLKATCHIDRYDEDNLQEAVSQYDSQRNLAQPYATQRFEDVFGSSEHYGWSDDKVRQYSQPERADFAEFVRSKGFRLD